MEDLKQCYQLQQDEILCLDALYVENFTMIDKALFQVRIQTSDSQFHICLEARFQFSETYPLYSSPSVKLFNPDQSLNSHKLFVLQSLVDKKVHELIGRPMIMDLILLLEEKVRIYENYFSKTHLSSVDTDYLFQYVIKGTEDETDATTSLIGSFFTLVPLEIILKIFQNVTGVDLIQLCLVCKYFNNLASVNSLWVFAFSSDFGSKPKKENARLEYAYRYYEIIQEKQEQSLQSEKYAPTMDKFQFSKRYTYDVKSEAQLKAELRQRKRENIEAQIKKLQLKEKYSREGRNDETEDRKKRKKSKYKKNRKFTPPTLPFWDLNKTDSNPFFNLE